MIKTAAAAVLAGIVAIAAAHAANRPAPVNPMFESVPEGEDQLIGLMREGIKLGLKKQWDAGVRPAMRDAHAKAHGCVQARFRVLDDDEVPAEKRLSADLHLGVFRKGGDFPAWIRYSNGSGEIAKDSKGDGRGMAVKLMGVEGEKLLKDDERETQDFLMINHPVFFVKNVADYAAKRINPAIGLAIQSKKVGNPLDIQYWSMVPIDLGPENVIKYSAVPCSGEKPANLTGEEPPDHLRQTLTGSVAKEGGCFDFFVQLFVDHDKTPIEDPTIEWDPAVSPFRLVARMDIPAGQTVETGDFCEDLSMTPWHADVNHVPRGGVQRARFDIYQEISAFRHGLNGRPRVEPKPAAF